MMIEDDLYTHDRSYILQGIGLALIDEGGLNESGQFRIKTKDDIPKERRNVRNRRKNEEP